MTRWRTGGTLAVALLAPGIVAASTVAAAPGVAVDALSGAFVPGQVRLQGTPDNAVAAVVADGHGGWYVGGRFTVGRLRNLVHVRADGRLDRRFRPQPDGGVGALARRGRRVFVGGYFRRLGGRRRPYLAQLDGGTGAAVRWSPRVPRRRNEDAAIYAMAVAGRTVYVGADRSAAFDTLTARPVAVPMSGRVLALAVAGHTLYLGRPFPEIPGDPEGVVAIDLRTHRRLPFATGVACSCPVPVDEHGNVPSGLAPAPPSPPAANLVRLDWPALDDFGHVGALAVDGRTLYLGGSFDSVGGQPRRYVAAVDRFTGAPLSFAPDPGGMVLALAVANDKLYVGTGFGPKYRANSRYASAYSLSTGAPSRWTPQVPGPVVAVAISGRRAYVGGVARVICAPSGHCRPG